MCDRVAVWLGCLTFLLVVVGHLTQTTPAPRHNVEVTINNQTKNKDEEKVVPVPHYARYGRQVWRVLAETEFNNLTAAIVKKYSSENRSIILKAELNELGDALETVLRNDPTGEIQKRLNYVKKRELDTIRRQIIPRKKHMRADFKEPNHLNLTHLKFSTQDLKLLLRANEAHYKKFTELRQQNFKLYEMEKRFVEKQRIRHMNNDFERKAEQERIEKERAEKAKLEMPHPLKKEELERVWEEKDNLPRNEFDPKTFFSIHDIDGNRVLDIEELTQLLEAEVDPYYAKQTSIDPVERREETQRRLRHVLETMDTNKDLVLDFTEFVNSLMENDEEKWETLENQSQFEEDEFEEFEKKKIQEIRESFARGEKPDGYDFKDVPLLNGNFLNETHVKVGEWIIPADDTPHDAREKFFKDYEMKKRFLREQKLAHIQDPLERQRLKEEMELHDIKTLHLDKPFSPAQLAKVGKEMDNEDDMFMEPEAFFHLHDVDSNGYLDKQEMRLTLITEVQLEYAKQNKTFDLVEVSEMVETLREEVTNNSDKNRDSYINLQEFLDEVERVKNETEIKKIREENMKVYWANLHEDTEFTEEEYHAYRNQKLIEIRKKILSGELPSDYNYTDIPQFGDDFVNATHIKKNGTIINLHWQPDEERNVDFKKFRMLDRMKFEHSLKGLPLHEAEEKRREKEEQIRKYKENSRRVNKPLSDQQEKETWSQEDGMDASDFETEKFFKLHDIDQDGEWNTQEIVNSFTNEVGKVYNLTDASTEQERQQLINKWLDYVFKNGDRNRNGKIDYGELLNLKQIAIEKNFDGVMPEDYSEDEFQQFKKDQEEIQQ